MNEPLENTPENVAYLEGLRDRCLNSNTLSVTLLPHDLCSIVSGLLQEWARDGDSKGTADLNHEQNTRQAKRITLVPAGNAS
jgi:hypothetical protein